MSSIVSHPAASRTTLLYVAVLHYAEELHEDGTRVPKGTLGRTSSEASNPGHRLGRFLKVYLVSLREVAWQHEVAL